jgi:hypothetical protein
MMGYCPLPVKELPSTVTFLPVGKQLQAFSYHLLKYMKALFCALVAFLKKWVKIKNDISIKKRLKWK